MYLFKVNIFKTVLFTFLFAELTRCEQVKLVLTWTGKAIALPLLLYIFICSLDFLSSSFRILGGKAAGR